MKKWIVQGWIWMGLFLLSTAVAQEITSPVEQYKQERLQMRAYERFLFARKMLEQSPDANVIQEAFLDAVRYATSAEDDLKALQSIEIAISWLEVDCEAWREAILARAKMLTRLNRIDEAETLFQNAIQKNWNRALLRYSESLIDNDEMVNACLLECERIGGLEKYAKYRGEEESLEIFLTLLRQTKVFDPTLSLVDEIAGHLDAIADQPAFPQIIRALCVAEDGNEIECLQYLDEIDTQLSQTKDHREYKHIPLYKASILFKVGSDYPAAEAAFTEFMHRNAGKNRKIAESALRIARDIEMRKENCPKMDEILTFLIHTEWFQDEAVQKDLTDDNKAEIHDVRGVGLAWSGDYVTAARIAKMVSDLYPNTLAGTNCLRNYAMFVGYHDGNKAESIRMLKEILTMTTFDETIASIRVIFAESAMQNRDYNAAIDHLQEALDHISFRKKGSPSRYRQEIQEKLDRAIYLRTHPEPTPTPGFAHELFEIE